MQAGVDESLVQGGSYLALRLLLFVGYWMKLKFRYISVGKYLYPLSRSLSSRACRYVLVLVFQSAYQRSSTVDREGVQVDPAL